uniref:Uncharacterized protein n=1 Tax=Kalanchoe fedtschenkoi TaxID=63787 RepID=A0A7N0RHE1_KALFE
MVVPHLDLLTLAMLHGFFISCILLLLVIFLIITLITGFFIATCSLIFIDFYSLFLSQSSFHFRSFKDDLKLGLVLLLIKLVHYCAFFILHRKPLAQRNLVSKVSSRSSPKNGPQTSTIFM